MTRLVSGLRQQLPAPIAICKEAIIATDGDLQRAYELVVRRLVIDVANRTGATVLEATAKLHEARFDVERAIELWHRENPPPEPPQEQKLAKGIALAASIQVADPMMRRYAHVIPLGGDRFELRLITHHERFSETNYGWDYDYALKDLRTRVTRIEIVGIPAVFSQLAKWGTSESTLKATREFDSCLINSPLDYYILPGRVPHLSLDDETVTA